MTILTRKLKDMVKWLSATVFQASVHYPDHSDWYCIHQTLYLNRAVFTRESIHFIFGAFHPFSVWYCIYLKSVCGWNSTSWKIHARLSCIVNTMMLKHWPTYPVNSCYTTSGRFYQYGLTLIPVWMCNNITKCAMKLLFHVQLKFGNG